MTVVKGKYFYGTEIVLLDNGEYGYKGGLRFKKNTNPHIVATSRLRFGKHTSYNDDKSVNDNLEYRIIGDSSYIIK
ncbi:hypothetical protein [Chryseobacterium sp. CT-SW4]|uniref:hypothetical protein n=1 Tax=Chryseobacterium sp. SW-1 TaxID=3157343 RepID=UPI003B02D7A0